MFAPQAKIADRTQGKVPNKIEGGDRPLEIPPNVPSLMRVHLLFDKHYGEQNELVDAIAKRIQLLGGVSLATAADVVETTQIERAPRGREEVPVQLSRLIDAHQIIG